MPKNLINYNPKMETMGSHCINTLQPPRISVKKYLIYLDTIMFKNFLKENNLPKYKEQQIYEQYYKNPIQSWDELTTWSKELREKIKEEIPFSSLKIFQTFESKDGRTTKLLAHTEDGHAVETVLMKSKKRNTVCVSCMSGCPVGCKFCATGQMGFNRNLTDREIIDQIMYFKRELYTRGQRLTNIVFMGMGEPMLNLENISHAIGVLADERKIGLSTRRITVSTVGYIDQLKKFLKKDTGVKIAVSLHSPLQRDREKLMPNVAKTNPLDKLIETLIDYQKRTNKRVTYEYLLLRDINDTPKHAKLLAKLLKNQIALVNLISFNATEGIPFESSSKKTTVTFQEILDSRGINNTLRHSYGNDIKAACGQLAKSG